jgi:hypothetical protein
MSRNVRMMLAVWVALSGGPGCGSKSGDAKPSPGPTSATIAGTVSGTVVVAVDRANHEVARTTATGAPKSFSLEVPAGGTYRLFLIEHEGTAEEQVFPLYQGATNVFTISSAVRIDLGFVDTTSGRAVPAHDPLAVSGVASAGEDVTVPPALIPALNYGPLAVGNRWVYTSLVQIAGRYRTDEVIGTEAVGNSLAYIRERIEPAPDDYHERRWLAYASSDVLLLRIWANEGADPAMELSPPGIDMKISPRVGDSWSWTLGAYTSDTSTVESVSDTVTVPAGTFTHCVRVTTPLKIEHYAPGVGLVRLEKTEPHWVEELVYARVGTQTFGVAP